MVTKLSVEDAKKLIAFIETTNYKLAPYGDGQFESKQDAIDYVESDQYKPREALNVCFDTMQGDCWDSITVTYEDEAWTGIDHSMGGHTMTGDTIKEMLISYRELHDLNCKYTPIALIVN